MPLSHRESHRTERVGWLRASVLGANDGILSTASLVLGVAAAHATHSNVLVAGVAALVAGAMSMAAGAAHATHSNVLVAGVAALVAGAMSMAAGEYVSVHSQADTERADLKLRSEER